MSAQGFGIKLEARRAKRESPRHVANADRNRIILALSVGVRQSGFSTLVYQSIYAISPEEHRQKANSTEGDSYEPKQHYPEASLPALPNLRVRGVEEPNSGPK